MATGSPPDDDINNDTSFDYKPFVEAMEATDSKGPPTEMMEGLPRNKSTMVAGQVMKAAGLTLSPKDVLDTCIPTEPSKPFEGYTFNLISLKDMITDQEITTKIRPVLISFSGLPNSGKTMAVDHIINRYVDKDAPLTPVKKEFKQEAIGITYHELVATGFKSMRNLCINEVTKESSFAFGIFSAFKLKLSKRKIPQLVLIQSLKANEGFNNHDLDGHLRLIFQYLSEQELISNLTTSNNEDDYARYLKQLLPEGIALINIWDIALNKTVLHFLTALRGHLYNNHCWLFLDLERDLDNLDKPPEIKEKHQVQEGGVQPQREGGIQHQGEEGIQPQGEGEVERDGAVLMKWRPRLHYLLRSCRMSESKEEGNKRRRVCTIFAKHSGQFNGDLQEKIKKLENKIQPVAKHIGVAPLLEEKVENINLGGTEPNTAVDTDDNSRRLYQKFQQVIYQTPFEDVPISWVFLRSFFLCNDKMFITRSELKEMADKCGIKDFDKFCKFYMSFGSIIDLSLVNPDCQYVIVKPIGFLRKLDKLLYPSDKLKTRYPTILNGIFPEKACKDVFGEDWHVFMNTLSAISLATKVATPYIEILPPENIKEYVLDRNSTNYYISLSRTTPLFIELDINSVHIITSINTPHVFKQVTITERLLDSLPAPKLIPCPNMNRTIIKDASSNTTLTLVSHSPATRLHLDKPNVEMCSRIVEAYRDIAATCGATTKYKFVILCSNDVIPDVKSIPSSSYHILPDKELCAKCKADDTKMEIVKVWNEVLEKCSTEENSRPNGDMKISEIANISETLASWKINTKSFIEVFQPEVHIAEEYKGYPVIDNDKVATEIILSWHKKERGKGNKEIRRAFARKLSELGNKLTELEKNECERLAKEIDVYYIQHS